MGKKRDLLEPERKTVVRMYQSGMAVGDAGLTYHAELSRELWNDSRKRDIAEEDLDLDENRRQHHQMTVC